MSTTVNWGRRRRYALAAIVAGIAVSFALYSAAQSYIYKGSKVWNFDSPTDSASLNQFLASQSNSGDAGNWTIIPDATAPSPPNVLERIPGNQSDSGYHILVMPDGPYQTNLQVGLKFKMIGGGHGNEAVGMIVRLQDGSHYFVLYADYAAQRFSLCRADPGEFLCTQDKNVAISVGNWHNITAYVSAQGIAGSLDNKLLLQRYDQHYQTGTVGILVKGNSKAYFDDLSAEY